MMSDRASARLSHTRAEGVAHPLTFAWVEDKNENFHMRFTSPHCVLPLGVTACMMPSRDLLFFRDLHSLALDIKPNNLKGHSGDDKGIPQVIAINMSLVCP